MGLGCLESGHQRQAELGLCVLASWKRFTGSCCTIGMYAVYQPADPDWVEICALFVALYLYTAFH